MLNPTTSEEREPEPELLRFMAEIQPSLMLYTPDPKARTNGGAIRHGDDRKTELRNLSCAMKMMALMMNTVLLSITN